MMRSAFLFFLLATAAIPFAAAAAPYVPLEPLPFVKATSGALSFADLLNGFFQLSLVLGAAITAVMLTVGGVQYMTSDAAGGKQQGKDRIRNAALGFLLLLSVYVIIKTINPDLLVFDLSRITDVGCRQGQCVAKNTPIGRTVIDTAVQGAPVTQTTIDGRFGPGIPNPDNPQEVLSITYTRGDPWTEELRNEVNRLATLCRNTLVSGRPSRWLPVSGAQLQAQGFQQVRGQTVTNAMDGYICLPPQ